MKKTTSKFEYEFNTKNLPYLSRVMYNHHIDPKDLKTERQALFMAIKATGYKMKFPSYGEPIFPRLFEIEKMLKRKSRSR